MDIDCDGAKNPLCPVRAGSDTQLWTSFRDSVRSYGISDLDASIHNYVVLGNADDDHTPGYTTFRPQDYGVQPLSLMAVVCNSQLVSAFTEKQNSAHILYARTEISQVLWHMGRREWQRWTSFGW